MLSLIIILLHGLVTLFRDLCHVSTIDQRRAKIFLTLKLRSLVCARLCHSRSLSTEKKTVTLPMFDQHRVPYLSLSNCRTGSVGKQMREPRKCHVT